VVSPFTSTALTADEFGAAVADPSQRSTLPDVRYTTSSETTLPGEHALLHELWRISHFGWIAHATLLRSLTISAGHRIADAALAGHLQQLLDRGWMEQRSSAAHPGQREWRLTDSGRTAVRDD
jgi:hypothetical protein